MDVMNYGIREKYEQLNKARDRFSGMKDVMDWDRIKPLLSDLYKNDTEKDGGPDVDPVLPALIRPCR